MFVLLLPADLRPRSTTSRQAPSVQAPGTSCPAFPGRALCSTNSSFAVTRVHLHALAPRDLERPVIVLFVRIVNGSGQARVALVVVSGDTGCGIGAVPRLITSRCYSTGRRVSRKSGTSGRGVPSSQCVPENGGFGLEWWSKGPRSAGDASPMEDAVHAASQPAGNYSEDRLYGEGHGVDRRRRRLALVPGPIGAGAGAGNCQLPLTGLRACSVWTGTSDF
jgi:hypothetical protein